MTCNKLIIGIDPSTSGTCVCMGVGVDSYAIKRFPGAKPPKGEKVAKDIASRIARYEDIVGQVMDWIEEGIASRTDTESLSVVIEGYAFGGYSVVELAEFGGILRFNLQDINPSFYEVAANQLKKYVTGAGKGGKELVIAHLSSKYGLVYDTSDHYDSFGLFLIGLGVNGIADEPLNAAQRDVLAKLKSRLKEAK
jgi:Holliday junction resolvasome RuvABC endonuclease subunit